MFKYFKNKALKKKQIKNMQLCYISMDHKSKNNGKEYSTIVTLYAKLDYEDLHFEDNLDIDSSIVIAMNSSTISACIDRLYSAFDPKQQLECVELIKLLIAKNDYNFKFMLYNDVFSKMAEEYRYQKSYKILKDIV